MVVDLLDSRYYYSGIFIFLYSYYFISSIINLNLNFFPIFPNPLIWMFIFLSGLILSLSMQEVDHHEVNNSTILRDLAISTIPFLLLTSLLNRRIELETKRENDALFILGLKLIKYTVYLLIALYLSTILIIIVFDFRVQLYFLFVVPVLGLLGFEFGIYLSKITDENSKPIEFFLSLFASVIGSRSRRITTSFVILAIFIIFTIFDNEVLSGLVEF